ncbi:MAG: ABC transporter substrate-binding protein [Oscillospiraceae bacterium]
MKKLFFLIITFVLALTACGQVTKAEDNTAAYVFTDSLGREVRVDSYEKTVVASGSLAEIWQLSGGTLYGVTSDAFSGHDLGLPEDIKVYGDVKHPSAESIIADGVDFVILSETVSGHIELEDTFESAGVTIAYFNVESFDNYLSMLKICTDITGSTELYEKNGVAVQSEIATVLNKAEGKESPDILLLRAYSTGIKAKGSDNMTGKMLSDLGCVNIADSDNSLLEELSIESIILADPDHIFITTMGEDENAAIAQYEDTLASNPAWKELSAVKNGRVHILPKELFHYKPNARWGEAYRILEEILYEAE